MKTGWDNLKNVKFGTPPSKKKKEKNDPVKKSRRRTEVCVVLSDRYLYRRAYSESKLLDACGKFDFMEGYSYHFVTAGDVDSLSFLKSILRQQDLEYCLFSTWCMAAEDVLQFDEWVGAGKIKKLDAYVGEIFPTTYRIENAMLNSLFDKYKCGRKVVFRNHSKVYAGYGEKFAFAIESSANINTNPRTENTCITINRELYEFYKDYFDGIVSFERDGKEGV